MGHLTLAHAERAVNVVHERAEVNRLLGVDSRVIYPDEIGSLFRSSTYRTGRSSRSWPRCITHRAG